MKYALLGLLLFATSALAIVNPDAPDYEGMFKQRMATVRDRAFREANTTYDMNTASRKVAQALDGELNAAYKKLMATLPAEGQAALRKSQRRWLKYRDAEYAFLSDTFTRAQFGSSAGLTVGSARNDIVYDRAQKLWSYLMNF